MNKIWKFGYYPMMVVLLIGINIYALIVKQVEIDKSASPAIVTLPNMMNETFEMKETRGVILFKEFHGIPPVDLYDWRKQFISLLQSPHHRMITKTVLAEYDGDRNMFYVLFLATLIMSTLVSFSYSIRIAERSHAYKSKIFYYIEFIAAAIVILIAMLSPWLHGNIQFWLSYISWYVLLATIIYFIRIGLVKYSVSNIRNLTVAH